MARFEVGSRVRITQNAEERANRGREGTVRQIVEPVPLYQVEFDAALGGGGATSGLIWYPPFVQTQSAPGLQAEGPRQVRRLRRLGHVAPDADHPKPMC